MSKYESTNALPGNPYPERSGVLAEGIIDIPTSEYSLVGGMYQAIATLDLSPYVKLGNRFKGFPPQCFETKVWKTAKVTPGGSINDYHEPLPFTQFATFDPVDFQEHARFVLQNVYITADDVSALYLQIYHALSSSPARVQSFSYKLYNTIFEFTDT